MKNFNEIRSKAVAQKLLGMAFKFGGRGENKETDCYGILCQFYSEFGIKMPDYSCQEDWGENEGAYLREYAQKFRKLDRDEEPSCGDMVVFKNVDGACNHAGVYIGDGEFIHSLQKVGTKISKLREKPWKTKFYGYFRINEEVKLND